MDYLPPFTAITAFLTFTEVDGEVTVTTTYDNLFDLIRTLLEGIQVDEAWYLSQYPDVADAIRAGAILSATEHFLSNGYFEGRLPFPIEVDEAWYLEQNPDIAASVARGDLASAQQHFHDNCYHEGRLPRPA